MVDLPLTWSDDELGELNGTQFLLYTRQQQASVKTDYEKFFEPLFRRVSRSHRAVRGCAAGGAAAFVSVSAVRRPWTRVRLGLARRTDPSRWGGCGGAARRTKPSFQWMCSTTSGTCGP